MSKLRMRYTVTMPESSTTIRNPLFPFKIHVQPLLVLFRFLVILSFLAAFSWVDWQLDLPALALIAARFGLLVFGSGAAMQVLKVLKVKPSVRWEHRFISCLILFLLFAPDVVWWAFPVLGVVTEGLQRLIRLPSGPVANPAALGGLVTTLLLQSWDVLPTWWGVSFAPRWFIVPEGLSVATLLVLPIAGWIAWKYKKLSTTLALIAVSAVAYVLVFRLSPAFLIFEGTLLFFGLVMTVEPKTSPILPKEQLIFGASVGLLIVALQKIYFVEPYLGALVVINVIYNGSRWWKIRQMSEAQKAKASTSKPGGTTSLLPAKG